MKITIVIPVYNVEEYIEDCLKSVAAQTYNDDIECIIINDCTPDGSCYIIERFIKEYNGKINFKLQHHAKNRGLSAARNTGIYAATGEYIYFLDSDDEITPDCIELLANPLKENKYNFVIGDYITTGTTKKFPPLLLNEGEVLPNIEIRDLYFKKQWYMMAVNKLCNLDYIRNEGLYFKEGTVNEDEIWSFLLACTAQSMYVVKKNTYIYKVRESSIMGKINAAETALAFTTIMHESYSWSKKRNILFNAGIINQLLFYRNYTLRHIFSIKSHKKQKDLYLRCCKKIRIEALRFCHKGLLTKSAMLREMYNYLPGIWGYWYLRIYCKFFKGRI
jgi:glycosyltransferase involved in cell wall biosynthesis